MNVNSENRVNASTIHGISSPRLCSEKCRCGKLPLETSKLENLQVYERENREEAKLAKISNFTRTGPEWGATTGFGTERLHPGVASASALICLSIRTCTICQSYILKTGIVGVQTPQTILNVEGLSENA